MKQLLTVLFFASFFSVATVAQADDGGMDKATAGKIEMHRRVYATYQKGAYVIVTINSEADQGLDKTATEKKKPATKPIAKK